MHTAVFLGFCTFNIAVNEVYTQTLSSCPYPTTKLSSNPKLLHFSAGTSSISALKKSFSTMPYFLLIIFNMFSFTFSETFSSLYGMLPINRFKFSPSIPSFSFFSIWSCAKCGNKSVIVNIGSSSFSPMLISTFSPFVFTTTPCIDSGIAVH